MPPKPGHELYKQIVEVAYHVIQVKKIRTIFERDI